jgi:hypothetical protein
MNAAKENGEAERLKHFNLLLPLLLFSQRKERDEFHVWNN